MLTSYALLANAQNTNRWQSVSGTNLSYDLKSIKWCKGQYFTVDPMSGMCRIGNHCDMSDMTGCYSGLVWINTAEERKRVRFDCKNYFLDKNRNVAPESDDEKVLDSICINKERFVKKDAP